MRLRARAAGELERVPNWGWTDIDHDGGGVGRRAADATPIATAPLRLGGRRAALTSGN